MPMRELEIQMQNNDKSSLSVLLTKAISKDAIVVIFRSLLLLISVSIYWYYKVLFLVCVHYIERKKSKTDTSHFCIILLLHILVVIIRVYLNNHGYLETEQQYCLINGNI